MIGELPRARTSLLDNLGRIRRELGPLTPELADALADHMGIRRGEVAEAASAYAYPSLPVETIRVCTGPVCACAGSRELLDETAVEVPCLGHCDLAPVTLVGDAVVPAVTHSANDGPALHLLATDEIVRIAEPTPERVVAELKEAGIVGYGGAGFPTWRKWEAVRRGPGPRAVVVNADEGEPGTIKDRYLLELRPQLVLAGIEAALRFAEADEAIVYVREEYATARARLREAADARGLAVRIVSGAGSYVCGEETALLESLEGRRPMPRLRPPFPAEAGYLGRPTLLDNVETLAHVGVILERGGAWWRALGLRGAAGTRLFSLSGAVRRPGCYEAPNGITLRELIEEHGGGPTEEIGCVVPGGAASGILPPSALDVPFTRDALAEWGCSPGSAGVQVFGVSTPVRRVLAETMRFFAEESCQKCTPCRIGTRALAQLAAGRLTLPRDRLERWLEAMECGSICGLGQAAPAPVRCVQRWWPEVLS